MSSLGTAQPRYQQTVLSPLARRLGFECAWVGDTLRAIGWGESQVIQTDTAIATAGVNPAYAPGGLVGKSFSGFGFGQLLLRCTDTTANTFIVVYAGLGAGSSGFGRLVSTYNGSGGHDIYYDGGGLGLQGFYSGGTTVRTISSVGTGSTPVCLAWSTDGTSSPTSLASVDGAAVTVSAAANSNGSRFAGGTQIGIGGRPDTTGRQSASQIFFVARSRFALDAVTLDRLTKGRAPWSLLLQPSAPRRIWAPVSPGLTAVESDFTASYSVVASLTKDIAASYTVVAAVQKDIAAAYNVQVAVPKDLAASYSVVASVSSDLAASYNVIAAVSKDLAAAYNVQVAVSKDLAAAYSVIAPVVSDLTASYNVIAAVQKDIAAAYDVVAAVQKDIAAAYDVVAAVSKDLSATYELLGDSTVVVDLLASYTVVGAVQKDLAASYSVFESAQQDLAASYTVFEAIAVDLSASYTVIASAQQDLAANYTVFKAVQQDLAASYTVIAAVVQNLTAAYDIESAGGGTGATAEQIAAAVWARIGEDGMPYGDIMRVFLAALAGRTQGIGTSTERYLSADGSKTRLEATFDANNNRVAVTLDGTP